MAEEQFVRTEHFDEFVKRIEERFDHASELTDQRFGSVNQRLADAEKAREQNYVHLNERFDDVNHSVNQRFDDMNRSVNQRFDDVNRSVNQRFDSLEKRFDDLRTLMLIMYTPIAIALLGIFGAAVKVIFFSK